MENMEQRRILHAFADCGVEGEALAAYGDVHRYTIKPRDNPVNAEVVQVDLMEDCPDERFDFGLFHPNCGKTAKHDTVEAWFHESRRVIGACGQGDRGWSPDA